MEIIKQKVENEVLHCDIKFKKDNNMNLRQFIDMLRGNEAVTGLNLIKCSFDEGVFKNPKRVENKAETQISQDVYFKEDDIDAEGSFILEMVVNKARMEVSKRDDGSFYHYIIAELVHPMNY